MAGFAITTDAGEFVVEAWAPPPLRVLGRDDRTCRVALAWAPGALQAEVRGCPAPVSREAAKAVGRWNVRAPAGLEGTHDLGEVWFVYPFEPEDEVRVLVRQSHAHALTLPEDVDAVPYAIRAWSFVRYPRDAHDASNAPVTCRVDVHADLHGVAIDVHADGCAAPFAAAAEGAVAEWRFDPPLVHGEPIPSAVTFATTFHAGTPPTGADDPPGAHVRQLWADRRFEELTREERLWFIRSTLEAPSVRDLGPGHVRVALPADPDLGGRDAPVFWMPEDPARSVASLPDHPPLLVMGKPDHLAVEVYELSLPDAASVEDPARGTRCDLIVQVDAERRVFSWAEACDPAARKLALATADRWVLRHDGGGTDARARFRARLAFDPDGVASVVVDPDELRSDPAALPAFVHTFRDAKPVNRVPPRLPRGLPLPDADCRLAVTVDARGHADRVEVLACPAGFEDAARRAVARWRWQPAEQDGAAVATETFVRIRFGR